MRPGWGFLGTNDCSHVTVCGGSISSKQMDFNKNEDWIRWDHELGKTLIGKAPTSAKATSKAASSAKASASSCNARKASTAAHVTPGVSAHKVSAPKASTVAKVTPGMSAPAPGLASKEYSSIERICQDLTKHPRSPSGNQGQEDAWERGLEAIADPSKAAASVQRLVDGCVSVSNTCNFCLTFNLIPVDDAYV